MVEQHRVRFGYGIIPEPAELERIVVARIGEMERVPRFVQQRRVVALPPAVRAKNEIDLLRHARGSTERARSFSGSVTDIIDDSPARIGVGSIPSRSALRTDSVIAPPGKAESYSDARSDERQRRVAPTASIRDERRKYGSVSSHIDWVSERNAAHSAASPVRDTPESSSNAAL